MLPLPFCLAINQPVQEAIAPTIENLTSSRVFIHERAVLLQTYFY